MRRLLLSRPHKHSDELSQGRLCQSLLRLSCSPSHLVVDDNDNNNSTFSEDDLDGAMSQAENSFENAFAGLDGEVANEESAAVAGMDEEDALEVTAVNDADSHQESIASPCADMPLCKATDSQWGISGIQSFESACKHLAIFLATRWIPHCRATSMTEPFLPFLPGDREKDHQCTFLDIDPSLVSFTFMDAFGGYLSKEASYLRLHIGKPLRWNTASRYFSAITVGFSRRLRDEGRLSTGNGLEDKGISQIRGIMRNEMRKRVSFDHCFSLSQQSCC